QVDLLLTIALGEFMFGMVGGQRFRAGLWLAGLLVKPQTAIILLPGLLIARQFRALAGFAFAAAAVLAVSCLLAGTDGMQDYAQLVANYLSFQSGATSPEAMMNWRSLGLYLHAVGIDFDSAVVWIGSGLTVLLALRLWLRRADDRAAPWGILVLASYAAACSVAWHSHV